MKWNFINLRRKQSVAGCNPGAWRHWAVFGLMLKLGWSAQSAPLPGLFALPALTSIGYHWTSVLPGVRILGDGAALAAAPVPPPCLALASLPAARHAVPFGAADPLGLSLTGQSLDDSRPAPGAGFAPGNPAGTGGPPQFRTPSQLNQIVDPSKWELTGPAGPWLPGEQLSDGYDDRLGLNTSGISLNNASAAALLGGQAGRTLLGDPLGPADFVTLGHLTQASALNFFEMARMVSDSTVPETVGDQPGGTGAQFVSTVIALKNLNSPCLFACIRDQWDSPAGDYNTVVVALNLGTTGSPALCATPEPSLCAIMAGFLGLAALLKQHLDCRRGATVVSRRPQVAARVD